MINSPQDDSKYKPRPSDRDNRNNRDNRDNRGGRDNRDSRDNRGPRDNRDGRDNRDNRSFRDSHPARGNYDDRDSRPARDKRDERDWRSEREVEPEGHMPQPAPGRRVISFGLPAATELPPLKKPRKPRLQKEIDDYASASHGLSEADFAAFNLEDYKDLSATPRRRSREAALLILFAACRGADIDESWSFGRHILADTGVEGDNAVFALDLARDAYQRREECDKLLSAYAREWDVERFSAVDLSILRLATAELLSGRGPDPTVIINEGVELGKKFGSEESGAFVNGMLDSIYNQELKSRADAVAADADVVDASNVAVNVNVNDADAMPELMQ